MIKSHYRVLLDVYEYFISEYLRQDKKTLTRFQKNPSVTFHSHLNKNHEGLVKEHYTNGHTKEAELFLLRGAQLGMAVFQSNANNGVDFPSEYDNEYLTIVGKKTKHDTGVSNWLLALQFNIIRRRQIGINYLMTVDSEVFADSAMGAQLRSFDYALVNLYKAIFTQGDVGSALVNAMSTFNPDEYEDEAYLYVSRLEWPQIAVIQAIFTADGETQYNEAMEQALLLHKEFYDMEEDGYANYKSGLPLPLIALASLAYDVKGYKLTVESDYLPDWMIQIDQVTDAKDFRKATWE